MSDKEFELVTLEVNGKSVYKSAKILRAKLLITRDDETDIHLELFDVKDFNRNLFQVANQVSIKDKYKNRYHVTILANGFPIIQIENIL